ncbi:acyltransferase family protein [Sphingomonas montana]|uniref:acyltransferase family protein n=1 Tax=Sphingomonas montana TaxID=1843236 RepID=UPI00096FE2D0|nr:acyltransferase [Sphingomonas montana]
MTTPPPPPRSRLVELDALRGLAALAVMLFHFTTRYAELYPAAPPTRWSVPWGHHGVELFFAISGFVIFVTLERSRTLADFAVSRASRLFPAYWTAILLTSAVMLLAGRGDLLRSPTEIAVNLTMLQGFVRVAPIDAAYWTLSIELAFYAVMALLWRCDLFRRIDVVLFGWLLLPWIWAYAPALTGHTPSWLLGLLLIQAQIPWFAIGIAAYRLHVGAAGRATWVIAAALVTIAGCEGSFALFVALPVTLAMLLVALRGTALLRWPPLVRLGGISYSLYLLHQNIGHALIAALEARGVAPDLAVAAAIGVAVLLATAVTHGIERPALHAVRRASARISRGDALPRPPSAPVRPSSPES